MDPPQNDLPAGNDAIRSVNCAISTANSVRKPTRLQRALSIAQVKHTPRISDERKIQSLSDRPVDAARLQAKPKETFLYLAYGSNLSAETFRGKRNVHPLAQTNVVVPSIAMTFDLPGIPYSEPCFANTRYRQPDEDGRDDGKYHKDRWHKGLVGVVYEVTAEDYAHIIATEGGGSGYQDVLVDCWELDQDASREVPRDPTGTPFRAHTLFAPPKNARADRSYAQPSARYKKLITDGAEEHDLPREYRVFLDGLRTYHTTTVRQKIGAALYLAIWGPVFLFVFRGGANFLLRPDGTYPPWFARIGAAIFVISWATYDGFFSPLFGDGERTYGDDGDDSSMNTRLMKQGQSQSQSQTETENEEEKEKLPLLPKRASTNEKWEDLV